MSNIKTYNGQILVHDYQLAYLPEQSVNSNSYIKTLTQCDAAGLCFNPTTLGWSAEQKETKGSAILIFHFEASNLPKWRAYQE